METLRTIRGIAGVRGVHVGTSPAGVAWVRWLRPGELLTAHRVRRDVETMRTRLRALGGKLS